MIFETREIGTRALKLYKTDEILKPHPSKFQQKMSDLRFNFGKNGKKLLPGKIKFVFEYLVLSKLRKNMNEEDCCL